ncbi:hypothetical protein OK016_13170 [Vibrio chagasii]|nr:hypothetical protein [Vibrio chagasii]
MAISSTVSEKDGESGLTQSMSRKRCCLDNAVAENFLYSKRDVSQPRSFEDADALIEQIKEYISTTIPNV